MGKLRISAKRGTVVCEDHVFYHYNGIYIGYTTNIGGVFYKSPGINEFVKKHGL